MLEFSDLPYQFIPPKPNNFIIGLGRAVNRFIGLKSRNHKLSFQIIQRTVIHR